MIKSLFRNIFGNIKSKLFGLRAFTVVFYLLVMFFVLYLPSIVERIQRSDELNICTFADLINEELLEQFTKETGIKVNCKYCELDSEIWTQLSMSNGKGLDIVTPIGLIASRLADAGLLQKIDHQLIKSFGGFHKVFLKKSFDPGLHYHIPFAWTYYAIGYKKDFFESCGVNPTSLKAIFRPDAVFSEYPELLKSYKVALFEDNPIELLLLGALSELTSVDGLTNSVEMKQVVDQYIIHRKLWLYGYVSANMRYYLSSVVPVVLTFAALLKDLIDDDGENFASCFPEEGSVLVAQNFCIPSGAKNIEAAHKFIDFFMSDKMLLEVFNAKGYLPPKIKLIEQLKEENPELESFIPSERQMDRLVSSGTSLTERQIEQAWLTVKCSP